MYTQDAYTQVRLDKDSKDKVSIGQDSKGESEGEGLTDEQIQLFEKAREIVRRNFEK